jgi:hypothetical protein
MTKPVSALEHYGVTAALCLILIVPYDLIQSAFMFLISPLVVFGVFPIVMFGVILFWAARYNQNDVSAPVKSYRMLSPKQVLAQTCHAPFDLN